MLCLDSSIENIAFFDNLNYFFTIIFAIEFFVKIIAFKIRSILDIKLEFYEKLKFN
jgi:hypothetical protein